MLTATSKKPRSGFFIGVGCPGCGGDLELDSDFFVIDCKYCGSVLRVLKPDSPVAYMIPNRLTETEARFHLDRYLKERGEPLTGGSVMIKKLYYPYWKVDGTLLKLRNKTERKTIYSETDSTIQHTTETNRSDLSLSPYSITVGAGARMPSVPESLGVRAETVTVKPFASENVEGDFDALPILRPWERVRKRLDLSLATIGDIDQADFGKNLTRLFDPVFSLVYFPYFLVESYDPSYRRFALEGLTGRVAGTVGAQPMQQPADWDEMDGKVMKDASYRLDKAEVDADEEIFEEPPEISFGELEVDFHRCTNCGVDLPPSLSWVYICHNCHQLKMLEKGDYQLSSIDIAEHEESPNTTLVPFWWLRLPEEQAVKFRTLMGGLGTPDKIVIPALRSQNYEALHRLAKRMTAASLKMPVTTVDELDDRFLNVRVSLTEAIAQAEVIITREMINLGRRGDEAVMELTPLEVGLLYVPFRAENYFFVDTVLGAVSMEKTLLE